MKKEEKQKNNNSLLANLDTKTKFIFIFLCIITFSIFYFYVKNKIKKAKKKNEEVKKQSEINKVNNEQTLEPKKSKSKNTQKTTKVKSTTPLKNKETPKTTKTYNNQEKNISNNQPTSNFKVSNKLGFDINKLIDGLGGMKNIKSVDASLSSLKVTIDNKELINQDLIKSLGAKGLMISAQKVSIIFGDNANAIKEAMIKVVN